MSGNIAYSVITTYQAIDKTSAVLRNMVTQYTKLQGIIDKITPGFEALHKSISNFDNTKLGQIGNTAQGAGNQLANFGRQANNAFTKANGSLTKLTNSMNALPGATSRASGAYNSMGQFVPTPPGGGGLNNRANRVIGAHGYMMVGHEFSAAGQATMGFVQKTINSGLEYERYLARMRQMGLDGTQIAEAKSFVASQKNEYLSQNELMSIFVDIQGSFRQSAHTGLEALTRAKTMLPVLAQYKVATQALDGASKAKAESGFIDLAKTIEMMGAVQDLPMAKRIADMVFKISQGSGKQVDPRQIKLMMAYGSSATNYQKLETFAALEPIIGDFQGSTVGVGLRTAYNRMSGSMSLPPKKMQGMLSQLGIGQSEHGQIRMNDAMLKLMQTDVILFAKKMMEVYKQHGLVTALDRERTNTQLFGTNGAKIYNKIMQQMPTLLESLNAFVHAKSIEETANDPQNKNLLATQAFHAKMDDLYRTIGESGTIELATTAFQKLGDTIKATTEAAKQHPNITKFGTEIAMLGGIALVAGGVLLRVGGTLEALGIISAGAVATLGQVGVVLGLAGYDAYKIIQGVKALNEMHDLRNRPDNLTPASKERIAAMTEEERYRGLGPESIKALKAQEAREKLSPTVAPQPAQTVQVHTTLNLDGKAVATAISQHQATALNAPVYSGGPYAPYIGLPSNTLNFV
jgi:hypothetical protein